MLSRLAFQLTLRNAEALSAAAAKPFIATRSLSTTAPRPEERSRYTSELLDTLIPKSEKHRKETPRERPSLSSSNIFFSPQSNNTTDTPSSSTQSSSATNSSAKFNVESILDNIMRKGDSSKGRNAFDDNQQQRGNGLEYGQNLLKNLSSNAPRGPEALRLNPSLGRTVSVNSRVDAVRALRLLETKCARNRVRIDQRDQKFHVRRGQAKKEARMRRWRKLFKASFKHTLSRCAKLRAQGW
ncbi:hypothetical protein KEM55_002914 [Ascosphaera atra]|nr:hypothetical protein KEM55_002914 [Ascosphaera atra]